MKTKLKYLLFWLLTLVSLSSTTHAITLRDGSYWNTYTYYSTSNWYNLYKNGNFSYSCISSNIVVSPENDKRYTKWPAICDDWMYKSISHYSSSAPIYKGGYGLSSSYKASYYYNNNSRYIFSISAVEVEDEIKIHKSKFKISSSGIYTIKSKRGSNVYSVASMRWPGMTFIMKDGDQVRWATYVNNMYMLDWYAISLNEWGSSFVFDSYKNKAYQYQSFWSSSDRNLYNQSLFPKLMNTVPTNVYNIEWNVGADYVAYYSDNSSDNVKFSLMEKRAWTKEDLKIIQQDLKDSITSLNEYSHYYLWLTPEDLQWISWNPKVPDWAKSENNTTNATEAQYNQCIAKYTNMRALTAHSDWCFGTDYNNEERMKYWHDVIDDSDDKYTTRDKTRYRRCYMFANYKSGLKKKLWEARDPFRKEWKSEYLWLEAKDVNPELLCGSKPSSSKKDEDYSYFAKPENNPVLKAWDWLRWRRWEPALITEKWEKLYDVDFQSDYNDLRSLYWKCQWLDRFWITKSLTQTPEQKQSACSKYASQKSEILKKWQWAKLWDFWYNSAEKSIQNLEKKHAKWLASNFANDFKETFSDLSDNWEALLNSVKVPFNSWYNSILPLQCSSRSHIEMMDYVLWWLFSVLAFIFFKML